MNSLNNTLPRRPHWWRGLTRPIQATWKAAPVALLLCCVLSTLESKAVVYQVGTGTNAITTSGITPYTTLYEDNRIQYLYLASELTGVGASAGNIVSLAINITSLGSTAPANVNIKIAQVTGYTNITALQSPTFTTVYSAASLSPATGWNTYTFGSPFAWNGTSNILVEICRDNSTWSGNYGVQCTQLASGVSRTYGFYDDGVAGCSMATGNAASVANRRQRPNMRFDIVVATPCAGTPVAGSVPPALLAGNACPGGTVIINATGTSGDTDISFQWQEWDGASWVNAVGGSGATTTSYTTPSIATTMQYRLRTTCANGGAQNFTNTCTVTPGMGALCYCGGALPTSTTDDATGLTRVVFNTIDQVSAGGPAYTDYTSVSTTVDAGASHNLAVQVNTAGNFTVFTKAWFDWDRNGVFTDPGEEYNLGSVTNVTDAAPNGSPQNVTIPMSVTTGPVMMRVRATYNVAALPCGNQNYSEAEDYTINVVACVGPAPSTSISGPATHCTGTALVLDGMVSGAADQYEWTGPGGFTASTEDATIGTPSPANSGTYAFRARNGVNGCWSAIAMHSVTVNQGLADVTANASDLTVCDGDAVDLTSSATFSLPPTILTENFNAGAPGWTQSNASTGGTPANAAWSLGANGSVHFGWTLFSNDASQFGFTDSDAQGSGSTTNTALMSPSFSLAGYGTAQLSFWQAYRDVGDAGDNTNVEVSTDGGGIWTSITQYTASQGAANAWVNAVLDLSAYAGQTNVMLRFRYTATWDWGWAIDNVSVTGTTGALTYAWTSDPAYFVDGTQDPTGVTVSPLPTEFTVTITAPNGCDGTASVTVDLDPTDTDGDAIVDCVDACPNDPDNDEDGDGICGDVDTCPSVYGQIGDACDDNNCYTSGDVLNALCVCAGTMAPCDNWTLTIESGANGGEITWSIQEDGGPCVLQTGGPYGNNTTNNVTVCVPQGNCFKLTMNDSGADGIVGGGWKLTDNNGRRILDNEDNGDCFASTSTHGLAFCNDPASAQTVIATHCDKTNWLPTDVIIASEEPAVSAQWGIGDQTDDGYQFWFLDPCGSYNRRIFRNHATSGGHGPANAIRATKLKLSSMVSFPLPQNTLLNVRVRSRVNGVDGAWGPACRFMIDVNACTLTQLNNDPSSPNYSCGVSGKIVGVGGSAGRVTALVVTSGGSPATHYRFNFAVPGEGYSRNITSTSATCQLAIWQTLPLLCGTYTYDVRVQASFDGGTTFCPYGEVCQVTITNNTAYCTTPGSMAQQADVRASASADMDFAMYPNPNREGQLFITMNGIAQDVEVVTVDIYDMLGQRATNATIAVAGGLLNTVLDLPVDMPAGMYLVNITAGDHLRSERLVVQR